MTKEIKQKNKEEINLIENKSDLIVVITCALLLLKAFYLQEIAYLLLSTILILGHIIIKGINSNSEEILEKLEEIKNGK